MFFRFNLKAPEAIVRYREHITFFSVFLVTLVYCVDIVDGDVEPVMATWIIFNLVHFICFGIHWRESTEPLKKKCRANILNASDTFSGLVILMCALIYRGEGSFFAEIWWERWIQIAMICISASTLCFAAVHPRIVHTVNNALMIVAYIPTVYHLTFRSEGNTESFLGWLGYGVAAAFGWWVAISCNDPLAKRYAGRATIGSCFIIGSMFYAMTK